MIKLIDRCLFNEPHGYGPVAVDQHIDLRVVGVKRVDQLRYLRIHCQVRTVARDRNPSIFYYMVYQLECSGLATHEAQVRAELCQADRDGPADSSASTCNDSGLMGKWRPHCNLAAPELFTRMLLPFKRKVLWPGVI
jgi:hypothetical protein